MNDEQIKKQMIEVITITLGYEYKAIVKEKNDKVPIFNIVFELIKKMNKPNQPYGLYDVDDKLFDELILETKKVLLSKESEKND